MNEIIAITGGIGSGKSQVLAILESAGEKVISCDRITDELYATPKVKKILGKMFPSSREGFFKRRINKRKIAVEVFADDEKLRNLTNFLTPLILQESLIRANRLGGRVFVEVPLLFECNAQDEFDKVIVICRDKEKRISSVMARSNLTREQVLERISAQFDYDSADLSKYTVLLNDGDLENLTQKTLELVK